MWEPGTSAARGVKAEWKIRNSKFEIRSVDGSSIEYRVSSIEYPVSSIENRCQGNVPVYPERVVAWYPSTVTSMVRHLWAPTPEVTKVRM